MSQWSKILQLLKDSRIQMNEIERTLYNRENFPIVIRDCTAEWLECIPWAEINQKDPSHEQFAIEWGDELIRRIKKKEEELPPDDFLKKSQFCEAANNFKVMCEQNPFDLPHAVTKMLAAEKRLIEDSAEEDIKLASKQASPLLGHFEVLEKRTKDCYKEFELLQKTITSYHKELEQSEVTANMLIIFSNQTNGLDHVEQEIQLRMEQQQTDDKLNRNRQDIANQTMRLVSMLDESVGDFEKLYDKISEHLKQWRKWQQLAGNEINGDVKEKKVIALDMIQEEFEKLTSLIWRNKDKVENVLKLNIASLGDDTCAQEEKLRIIFEKLQTLLSSLLKSAFAIEDQPPQVLRRDAKFFTKVRFLLANLIVCMRPPVVKATMINEDQARNLCMEGYTGFNEKCATVINNEGCMELDAERNRMSVSFRTMTVKAVTRQSKRGTERIAEAKNRFLFQSTLHIAGREIHVWTLSLPVVVIVHGNQECNAAATILWDNTFSKLGKHLFDVPTEVPWLDLVKCLSEKFLIECGKGFSVDQENYLASKLFGPADDYSYQTVSWSQFCRDNLPGQKFSFWQWLHSCMKLTKEKLLGPWADGSLKGFISKEKGHSCLLGRPTGTFLLRFSESVLGGLTIVFVHQGKKVPEILDLHPFTDKDFEKRPFTDIIRDLKFIQTLYPDVPKSSAFGKYWSIVEQPIKKEMHGYVKWYFKIATAFMDIFVQS